MDGIALVFIGIDVVAEAVDVAESRRWQRTRAPRGLWQRLGVGTGAVLRHPDAPLLVAVAPADSSFRGVGEDDRGALRIAHDGDVFAEAVEDCPVVEELVQMLLGADASTRAA